MSYAQHGDDKILLSIFEAIGIFRPSYLDIGAGHPINFSNTALFYERGSRGINVDANRYICRELWSRRFGDITLNCGIGAERGERPFYRVNWNPGLSSFDRQLAESHGECSPLMVSIFTVSDIVNVHAGGVFPDLLSIDIEGLDFEVLQQAIYKSESSPKVICAETICCCIDRTRDFVELLGSRGYRLHVQAGANGIFIREQFHALAQS